MLQTKLSEENTSKSKKRIVLVSKNNTWLIRQNYPNLTQTYLPPSLSPMLSWTWFLQHVCFFGLYMFVPPAQHSFLRFRPPRRSSSPQHKSLWMLYIRSSHKPSFRLKVTMSWPGMQACWSKSLLHDARRTTTNTCPATQIAYVTTADQSDHKIWPEQCLKGKCL